MFRTVQRRLELAFVLQGTPFAWRCSLCQRLFAPPGPELTNAALADIDRDFRVHVCYPLLEVQDITEFDKQPVPSSFKLRNQR
jgi:hypothetical protein